MAIRYSKPVRFVVISIALLFLFPGCFSKGVGPMDADGKRLTWKQMNLDQRKAHMKKEVLPRAAELFGSWRPERFASVDCTLCHGQDAKSGKFQMPTAHLPRHVRPTLR